MLGAHATELDVHGFVPAALDPDARDLLSVRRAGRIRGRSGYFGAIADYAKAPLVARASNGDQFELIDHLATVNLVGGFSPIQRLRIDMVLPAYGFLGESADRTTRKGFGLADARVAAMVSLIAPPLDANVGFGLAVVPHLDLPTGQFHDYLGRRRVAGGGVVAATVEAGPFTASAEGGIQLETKVEAQNLSNSDSIRYGAGIGILVDPNVGLNIEVAGLASLDGQVGSTESPVEALAHLRYGGDDGGSFVLGGAMGISQGAGSSTFRIFLGAGFGSTATPRDRDHDGIVDRDDACPNEAETINGLKDADGCPDALPRLTVRVRLDGKDVEGAEVRLQGPASHAFQTSLQARRFDATPDSSWKASARYGACLTGRSAFVMGESDGEMAVDLQRTTVGDLKVVVFDVEGNLLPGVTVRLESKQLGCVPEQSFTTPPNEPLFVPVGQGVHTITLRNAGAIETREFTVVPGKTAEIVLVMGG